MSKRGLVLLLVLAVLSIFLVSNASGFTPCAPGEKPHIIFNPDGTSDLCLEAPSVPGSKTQPTIVLSSLDVADLNCTNVAPLTDIKIDSSATKVVEASVVALKGGSHCKIDGHYTLFMPENARLDYSNQKIILIGNNMEFEYYGIKIRSFDSQIILDKDYAYGKNFGLDCALSAQTYTCEFRLNEPNAQDIRGVDLKSYLKQKLAKVISAGNKQAFIDFISKYPDLLNAALSAKITNAEINDALKSLLEGRTAALKKEFDDFKAGVKNPNTPAGKEELRKKSREIYSKDSLLNSYAARQKEMELRLASLPKNSPEALALKRHMVALEIATAERKKAITGEDDPALITKEILDIHERLDKLKSAQSYLDTNLRKIAILGAFVKSDTNNNGINDAEEITQLEKTLGDLNSRWEDSFFKKVQEEYRVKRFDPRINDFVSVGDVVSNLEKTAYDYGKHKAIEIGVTAISGGMGGLVAGQVAKHVILEGAAKYLLVEGANALTFHAASNILNAYAQGVDIEEMDWSPGAFANSFLTLQVFKATGTVSNEILKRAPLLTSVEGEAFKLTLGKLPFETASFAALDIADRTLRGQEVDIAESLRESAILAGGLSLAHIPGTVKNLELERQSAELSRSLLEKFPEGNTRLELSAFDKVELSRLNEITLERSLNNLERLEFAREEGKVSSSDFEWAKRQIDYQIALSSYKRKEMDLLLLESNNKITREELLLKNPELLALREDALFKGELYAADLIRLGFGKEIQESILEGLAAERQKLEQVKRLDGMFKEYSEALEEVQRKGPDSVLTNLKDSLGIEKNAVENLREAKFYSDFGKYAEAEMAAREASDKAKFGSEESADAHLFLAEVLFKQGKYQESILTYDVALQSLPSGGRATEVATLQQARAFEALGNKDSAIRIYEKLKESSLFSRGEIEAKIQELSVSPLTLSERNGIELALIKDSGLRADLWIAKYAADFGKIALDYRVINSIREKGEASIPEIKLRLELERSPFLKVDEVKKIFSESSKRNDLINIIVDSAQKEKAELESKVPGVKVTIVEGMDPSKGGMIVETSNPEAKAQADKIHADFNLIRNIQIRALILDNLYNKDIILTESQKVLVDYASLPISGAMSRGKEFLDLYLAKGGTPEEYVVFTGSLASAVEQASNQIQTTDFSISRKIPQLGELDAYHESKGWYTPVHGVLSYLSELFPKELSQRLSGSQRIYSEIGNEITFNKVYSGVSLQKKSSANEIMRVGSGAFTEPLFDYLSSNKEFIERNSIDIGNGERGIKGVVISENAGFAPGKTNHDIMGRQYNFLLNQKSELDLQNSAGFEITFGKREDGSYYISKIFMRSRITAEQLSRQAAERKIGRTFLDSKQIDKLVETFLKSIDPDLFRGTEPVVVIHRSLYVQQQ